MSGQKITAVMLGLLADRINRVLGHGETALWNEGRSTPGMVYFEGGNGGHCLRRMSNDVGGSSDVLSMGYASKREAWDAGHAFARGIELGKELGA